MNANEREYDLDEVAERIVGAAYRVSNALGPGFVEKVYERALLIELRESGIQAKTQVGYPIFYRGRNVGTYCADFVVEGRIIVELKCVDSFSNEHIAQCLNYLTASQLKLALLVNFQKARVEWKRLVLGK